MLNIKPNPNQTLLNQKLLHAVINNQSLVVYKLLSEGADTETKFNEQTPLMIAIKNSNKTIVTSLICFNANLLAKDERGLTAFQIALESQNKIIIEEVSRWDRLCNYNNCKSLVLLWHYKVLEPLNNKWNSFLHNLVFLLRRFA